LKFDEDEIFLLNWEGMNRGVVIGERSLSALPLFVPRATVGVDGDVRIVI